MKSHRITRVVADAPLRLTLTWADGRAGTVDLAPLVEDSAALAPLRDPDLFARATLGEWGWSVDWIPDELDLGTDQLRRLLDEQQGRVMPAGAFAAWRARLGLTLDAAAEALGISRRMAAYYDSDTFPVPRTVWLATRAVEHERAAAADA